MRYTADHPLLLGDDVTSTPPRHVVATGVGVGMGFQLHEELWVRGDHAETLVDQGMFVLLEDEAVEDAPADVTPPVDPVTRRKAQIRERADGLAQAVAEPLGARVRVFRTDGSVTEHEAVEDDLEDAPPAMQGPVGMPPPPITQTAKPRTKPRTTKGTI